ncbi:MAG: DUF4365 domain-containing protein [Bacillaceae bacterium]|nr:DUF4365 domain-containing protein [Bacillaceae bacterium]
MSPKRTESHIIGDDAVDIVKRCLPKHWILRNQGGDNDYGIDVEIELVQNDGEVTGTIFKGQIKGHKNINFKDSIYKKSISTDKLKYWLRFSMPVILFEVDTTAEEVFWVDAQLVARRVYSYLNTQDSKQIKIRNSTKLSVNDKKESQKSIFLILNKVITDYNWKSTYGDVKGYFNSFIPFLEVWSNCRFLDFHMEMDNEEYNTLKIHYQQTKKLAQTFYISLEQDIPQFDTWFQIADEKWDGIFTYSLGLEACNQILKYVLKIMDFVQKIVLNLEEEFWKEYDWEFQQEVKMINLPMNIEEDNLLDFLGKHSN